MKILCRLYDGTVRKLLPRKNRVLSGVAVRDARLFDATDVKPDVKQGLYTAITENVSCGDRVDLIGFGRGVSTVKALRAGAEKVTVYEAAEEAMQLGERTLRLNQVDTTKVNINHATVGSAIDVWGEAAESRQIDPEQLSLDDVLIMDCEGAELEILRNFESRSDVIIVESHPGQGSGAQALEEVLESAGYDSIERREYEPGYGTGEKSVLVARLERSTSGDRA